VFTAILFTQWKWSRLLIAAGFVAAFTLPILTVQGLGFTDPTVWVARDILRTAESRSVWYAVLAAGIGLLLATSVWSADHGGDHVYALSLPVARWRLVVLRFAAGGVLLLVPVAAFWAGALLASAALSLPYGLHAYPTALALRFGLATVVAYAVFFAISSGTTRAAGMVLAIVGGLVVVRVLLHGANVDIDFLQDLFGRAVSWPGPFGVFAGRWALIGV
jgi:hypothetical protein